MKLELQVKILWKLLGCLKLLISMYTCWGHVQNSKHLLLAWPPAFRMALACRVGAGLGEEPRVGVGGGTPKGDTKISRIAGRVSGVIYKLLEVV